MLPKASTRILSLFFMLCILLTACRGRKNDANKLVGKWEHKEQGSGITVTLEFTQDKLSFSSQDVAPASTSYTYVDEDTITYHNLETGVEVETNYSIAGDKLTIAFYGETNVYTRVK